MNINSLKKLIPLLFGLFLIYYSYENTSVENRINIINSILKADYKFVLLSIFFGILSHISRAVRWKYLLNPLGYKLNQMNSVMSIFACFLSNLGVPRSGEVLRATIIHYYEKIPFEKSFGTIVTERIIDVIILLSCILIGMSFSSKITIPKISINFNFFLCFLIFCVILFLLFKLINKKQGFSKITIFFNGLKKGVFSVSNIKNKFVFYIHTVFIWSSYFFMFYVIKFSMAETFILEIEAIFVAFVAGVIAMSLTNGGIGAYPLAIAAVLNQYEIPYETSLAFGWIVWTSQTLMIIVFGSLSFVFLPILNKN